MAGGLDEQVEALQSEVAEFQERYESIQERLSSIRSLKKEVEEQVDIQASNIDFDRLAEFVTDDYWLINEIGENEYEVWIPKFMDVQAGVLDRQKGGYNVFILNQTTKMVTGIPEFLKSEVDMDDEQRFHVRGDLLEFDEQKKDMVADELSDHVEDVGDGKATIKQDHGYALVRDLLDRGEIPFTPMPVSEDDLRESETTHELYDYQERAYQRFLEHGAVTVAYMTGGGKTHIGMEALDTVKYDKETGRKAVVVYSKITARQWKEKIGEYAPRLKPIIATQVEDVAEVEGDDIIEIYTYQGLGALEDMINKGYKYNLIEFDEADFLPAKTFSRASTYPAKYRIGLTASPIRSQSNPNDVFALCGRPVGMDWEEILEQLDKSMFPVNIHTVTGMDEKIDRMKEVLDGEKVTLVFVESIEFGERISEETGLEFVHGSHRNQRELIDEALAEDNAVIVSRIANRGMSIGNVERLIEVDNRGDSRREIIQRLGRLFHGHGEQADVIYTVGEANKYKDRFLALIERGFDIHDVDNALEFSEIEDSGEAVVDITVEGDDESPGWHDVEIQDGFDDPIEFLKDERIKDMMSEAMEGGRYSQEKMWDGVIAIATKMRESGDGMSPSELADATGASEAARLMKPLRDEGLVKKEGGEYILNVEDAEEAIRQREERKKLRQEIGDIKNEVLGE